MVRTVWAGGVRALNGNELGENELCNFAITLTNENDTIIEVILLHSFMYSSNIFPAKI